MNRFSLFCLILLQALLYSCSSIKNYTPQKKYAVSDLQQDYTLLRNILEKKHPSLYWYTSKDSIDMYFNKYYNSITDSMTEQQFGWKVLAPLTNKIKCGHTSFGRSKNYAQWSRNKKFPSFPLSLKCWNDTMVITSNMNRKDSVLRRGMLISSINGIRNKELTQTLFEHMTKDADAENVNYLRLSSNFPYYHRNIFGISKAYVVTYIDSAGLEKEISLPVINLEKDTTRKQKDASLVKRKKGENKQRRIEDDRSLAIDTANNTAIITINTFSSGRLRTFFRHSFHYIKQAEIKNVVIDLRSNGGGKIKASTLLTKYVSRIPFKVADSSFTVVKSLRPYTKYIKQGFLNNLGLFFLTRKSKSGVYHFKHWEKKVYQPKTNNHYSGDLYILINGSTFSASTIFCNVVKGQEGVTLAGEEAGGGWYGNNGILIPDITLPKTGLRVRLPLFRLVQFNHVAKDGRGVMPDMYIGTSYDALLKGFDKKKQVVMEMIKEKNRLRN